MIISCYIWYIFSFLRESIFFKFECLSTVAIFSKPTFLPRFRYYDTFNEKKLHKYKKLKYFMQHIATQVTNLISFLSVLSP